MMLSKVTTRGNEFELYGPKKITPTLADVRCGSHALLLDAIRQLTL